ncbi:MAG TPA: hypothetical protein VGF05_21485 [Bryobacteraceae bacterium]|jgi:hypothetical protein
MPFHVGGHKPRPKSPITFSAKRRLGIGVMGVVSISAGAFTWLYDPRALVYAGTTVSLGVVIVLVSLIPVTWIEKLEKVIATGSRAPRAPAGNR